MIEKKCAIYLLVFHCFSVALFSQTFVPQFQIPVYFEDAVGNRDTVVIGYDTSQNSEVHNVMIDGVLLNRPFDSVLDVRILHLGNQWDGDTYTTKKIILRYDLYDGSPCGVSSIGCFAIQCKYPPLKMRYDSSQFALTTCRRDTWISADSDVFFVQYWWTEDFTCLAYASEITPALTPTPILPDARVLGAGTQGLPGFFWLFNPFGACSDTTLLSEQEQYMSADIQVFPNPATDELRLRIPHKSTDTPVTVYNSFGQPVLQQIAVAEGNAHKISLVGLVDGMYFLAVQDNTFRVTRPFLVMKRDR